jgi:hypothetical protein
MHVRALAFSFPRDEMMLLLLLADRRNRLKSPRPTEKPLPFLLACALVLRQLATDGDAGRTGEGSTRSIYDDTTQEEQLVWSPVPSHQVCMLSLIS